MVWAAFLRAGYRVYTYDDSHAKSGRPAFCEGGFRGSIAEEIFHKSL